MDVYTLLATILSLCWIFYKFIYRKMLIKPVVVDEGIFDEQSVPVSVSDH